MALNYSEQGKLLVALTDKLWDKEEQVKMLEAAILALKTQKDLAEEKLKRGAADLAKAQAGWEADKEKATADKAALEKVFEATKDWHANFAYIMAFAEAIRVHRHVDLNGDLSGMARGLADYIRDCPPDPAHYLEI